MIKKFSSAGFVIHKEKYMNKKILMSLFMILILNSCTEWAAILMSSGSLVVSQNAYSKAYGGVDLITIIKTKKDIKTHAKELLNDKER
jgi:hypothetical protein|tara:strand:+ start:509 stop:772 length:264 start_codon:yes stop_codon:yes gene_type:complete